MAELIARNPEAMGYLNTVDFGGGGDATMRLTNALMDWHDAWADR